jgi:signal transduction histidine kinase
MIALEVCALAPRLFERLVLIAPTARFLDDPETGYIGGFHPEDIGEALALMDANWAECASLSSHRTFDDPALAAEMERVFLGNDPSIGRAFALATFTADERPLLSKLEIPCLLVPCTGDAFIPLSAAEYMRDRLRARRVPASPRRRPLPANDPRPSGGGADPRVPAVMKRLPCALLEFDDDCVILDANARVCEVLGFDRAELLDGTLDRVLSRATRLFFDAHVFPMLAEQGKADELYVPVRTKSGDELPTLLYAAREQGPAGAHRNVLAFLPMHRKAHLEREVVRFTKSQLTHQDRLASLGTLAAGIAHEVNNPLAYVSANLDVMSELLSSSGPWTEARTADLVKLVTESREGAERIRSIISAMRMLARAGEERVVPFDLHRALALALRITMNGLKHKARVDVKSGAVPMVDGDEGRLSQVIINLVVNAGQALPEGRAENLIEIETWTDGDGRANIEVRDNGPGISAEALPRVFDPFFTTKQPGEGTGLGLSVCHGIVTAMHGTLTAESPEGQGARFRITLPPSASAQHPATISPVPAKPVPAERSRSATGKPRVLIVDDEPTIANTLARILREYDTAIVTRGAQAIERVKAGEKFDAVICDLMMPETTGIDVHAALREIAPDLANRMVFMTGGAFTPAARAFLDAVPNPHIEKPFDFATLRATCEHVVVQAPRRRDK